MSSATIAGKIASLLEARENCAKSGNTEWFERHTDLLHAIEKGALPSGSGIDSGTKIDLVRSTPNKLVLTVGFHHMNEAGFYDGWTEHTITVQPTFPGIDVTIGGRDRNDIKEYLADIYQYALSQPYSASIEEK